MVAGVSVRGGARGSTRSDPRPRGSTKSRRGGPRRDCSPPCSVHTYPASTLHPHRRALRSPSLSRDRSFAARRVKARGAVLRALRAARPTPRFFLDSSSGAAGLSARRRTEGHSNSKKRSSVRGLPAYRVGANSAIAAFRRSNHAISHCHLLARRQQAAPVRSNQARFADVPAHPRSRLSLCAEAIAFRRSDVDSAARRPADRAVRTDRR